MGQFRAILVVRTADGEIELGNAALEGTQVLAECRLKLVEAHQRLARERLHEVLVGVACRRLIDEIRSEHCWQQHVEEGGLEDAALAHEDEHGLAHHAFGNPGNHHRHEPLLEEILEVVHRMMVADYLAYVDALG